MISNAHPLGEVPAGSFSGTRALRALLAVALVYALLVSAALFARLELHRWGITIQRWQYAPLWLALGCHLAAAAVLGAGLIMLRSRPGIRIAWSRRMLAASPLLLLVSVDLVASIGYQKIHERIEIIQRHPSRYWTFRPGYERRVRDVVYKINDDGFRGPAVPHDKKDGERRIVFLGDSVTFGQAVNDEDSFVGLVRRSAEQVAGRDAVSVVNCSVTGYSPWQEADLLESECLDFEPDVIVQVFCVNDIGQKFRLVNYGGRTKHLAPPQPSAFEWSGLFRMSRALSFQWFGPSWDQLRAREARYAPDAVIDHPTAPHIQDAFRRTGESMDRIVTLARSDDRPLAVVFMPTGRQIDPAETDLAAPQRWLGQFCRERDIPMLDLTPVYRAFAQENGMTGRRLFPDDLHPTRLAHQIAAQSIYEFLENHGWLDRKR